MPLRDGANTMISATVSATFCRIILRSFAPRAAKSELMWLPITSNEGQSLRHIETERA
jgi:hypothetical protein